MSSGTIESRLIALIPFGPASSGVVVALTLLAIALAAYRLSGIEIVSANAENLYTLSPQAHLCILLSSLIGYGLGISRHLTSGSAAAEFEMDSNDRRAMLGTSRWAGAGGIALGMLVSFLTIREIRLLEPGRDLWNPVEVFVNAMSLALFWGIGRAMYFTVYGAGSRRNDIDIDLLDLGPVYRRGRAGLQVALAWIVGIALFVLIMMFDPNPDIQVDSAKVLLPLVMGTAVVAGIAILLPMLRLWTGIRKRKSQAIAEAVRALQALRASDPAGAAMPGREADLYARQAYAAALSDWPFDATTVGRFAFYVLIPVGSWLLGTLLRGLFEMVFMVRLVQKVMGLLAGIQ